MLEAACSKEWGPTNTNPSMSGMQLHAYSSGLAYDLLADCIATPPY
jgi:hypothetical protein